MRNKKTCIVIPARLGSSRFPGKPLVNINGKSMIQRVYERCQKSSADKIIVSTEDQEIHDHVIKFGECDLTPEFQNGTLRVCHTANKFKNEFDYVINVQGDEPFIDINFLKRFIRDLSFFKYGTILTGASDLKNDQMVNPNCVKLISNKGFVSGFTRSPFFSLPPNVFKHVGVYGFCIEDIEKISLLEPTDLSKKDSLEQISWLEDGFFMKYTMSYNESISIDTPDDLEKGLKVFDSF